MAKIIGGGPTVQCKRCRVLVSYDSTDIYKKIGTRFKYYQTYDECIRCPNCNNEISLGIYKDFYSKEAQDRWREEHPFGY